MMACFHRQIQSELVKEMHVKEAVRIVPECQGFTSSIALIGTNRLQMAFTLGKCRTLSNLLQTNADICRTAGVHIECNPLPFGHMVALDKTNVNQQSLPHCMKPVGKSRQFDVVFI